MFMSSSNAENEDFYFDQYDRDHQLLGQNDVSPGLPSFREQHTNPFINHANVLSDSNLTKDNQLFYTEDGNNLPQNGNKDQKRQGKDFDSSILIARTLSVKSDVE